MRHTPSACSDPLHRRRDFLRQGVATIAAVAGAAASPLVWAQGKPVVLKAVVQHRNGESWKKWLWLQEQVRERSKGQVSIEVTSVAELGLGGTEMLRVLKTGVIDMAEVLPGYVASDFPMIEACNLPGISTSFEMSRQLYDAWTTNVVSKRENILGGKIIASFCWNTLFVFTKFELNQLSDFKGKKIRVFAPAQARFITALGGEPVSLTTADVYPSLQRGIIDGCITGADQVKGSSLWEVTQYISNVNIPPMGSYIVLSARSQHKLPQQYQTIFTDLSAELTDLGWHLGRENDRLGLAFASEKGMVVGSEPKPEWVQSLTRISSQDIIPWWANRAGPQAKPRSMNGLPPLSGSIFELRPVVPRLINRLATGMAWFSGLLFLLLALYMTADALSRTLGGPFTGVSDQVAALTLALGATWSLAYGVKAGNHIRSDVLLPLLPSRLKHGFGVLALIGLSLFAWLLTWRAWALTLESWELGAMLPQSVIDLRLYLPQAVSAFGYLVFAISATLAALNALLHCESIADEGNAL